VAYEKKSKGISLFRLVAGQAIGRNKYASFSPVELRSIMEELDIAVPRSNKHMIPQYLIQDETKKHPTKA
jgi:hypothetical protein